MLADFTNIIRSRTTKHSLAKVDISVKNRNKIKETALKCFPHICKRKFSRIKPIISYLSVA